VEVFEVDPRLAVTGVTTWPVAGTERVAGGPESVLPLLEADVLGPQQAVRLAGEPAYPEEHEDAAAITDGYRDREVDVGRASDGASATLGAGTGRRLKRRVADYLPVTADGTRAVATVAGMTSVMASSSASDADALLLRGPDHNATAAFDGLPGTSWVTGGLVPLPAWVEARVATTHLGSVRVSAPQLPGTLARAAAARVTTSAGSTDVRLVDGQATVPLDVDTDHVRLTITAMTGLGPQGLGVTALEGSIETAAGPLVAQRGLRLAAVGGSQPADLVFSAARRDRPGCLVLGTRPVCAGALVQGDEDDDAVDRTATLPAAAGYDVAIRARARGGPVLDALLQKGQPITVAASSVSVPDVGDRPAAVLDRDLRTSWLASAFDAHPELRVQLSRPQRITGVTVVVDPELAASRPRTVGISVDDGPVSQVPLSPQGTGRIPAAVGDRLTLTFPDVEQRFSHDIDGYVAALPLGISELRVNGPAADVHQALRPTDEVEQPCGQGPRLEIDGAVVAQTRMTTNVGDLLAGRDLHVQPCQGGHPHLGAGEHRFRMAGTSAVQVTGLTLTAADRPPSTAGSSRVDRVARWDDDRREVDVAAGPAAFLVVHEAFNPGWTARLDGHDLPAVRLDGWQQGFLLPGSGGHVVLTFTPDRPYRAALLAGAALAVLLLLLASGRAPSRSLPPGRRRSRVWVGPLLAAVTLPLLGGVAGLVALAAVAAVQLVRPALLRYLGPTALVVAGLMVARQPWPNPALVGAPVQALGLFSAATLAVSLWWRPDRGSADASQAPPPPAAMPTPPAG
jgi:arabinofuranan 3-O-arabinosyltransferase